MLRKQLPGGKSVAFEKKAGSYDFCVALQIPITDKIKHEKAIAELKKRMLFFAGKNKELGDLLESPGNFHITLQVFFPNVDQIDKVKEILESLLAKQSGAIPIEITDKNAVFGDEKKNACYPVALVESKKLVELQLQFQEALAKAGIKYNNKFKFNPHVSLFVVGSRLNPDTLEGITNTAVRVDATFELSHKNDVNQFVPLSMQDLNFLSAEFKTKFKNPLPNALTPSSPKHAAQQLPASVIIVPPLKPPVVKPAPVSPELKFKLRNSIYKEDTTNLHKAKNKQTMQEFLADFAKLAEGNIQLKKEWYYMIKTRFIECKIGLYCINNNINANDAIAVLQKMDFKAHCEIKTTLYNFNKAVTEYQTWPAIKNPTGLLEEFITNLPHLIFGPSAGIIQRR